MANYDELRQAAEQTTPGKDGWEVRHGYLVYSDAAHPDAQPIAFCGYGGNANFIALSNPATIRALLDENAALRDRLLLIKRRLDSGEVGLGARLLLIEGIDKALGIVS